MREGPYKKLVSGILSSRGTDNCIQHGDAIIVLDGGRHGNEAKIKQPLQVLSEDSKKIGFTAFEHRVVSVITSEASVRARRRAIRTAKSMKQIEYMHELTRDSSTIPCRRRKVYDAHGATNQSEYLGPVTLLPYEEVWNETFKLKKELYGANRVAVGGEDTDVKDDTPDHIKGEVILERVDSKPEPVFYKSMPVAFYIELIHSNCLVGMIQPWAGDGAAAIACLLMGIRYVGFCFTEKHIELLYAHLEHEVEKLLLDPKSTIHQPAMAEFYSERTKKTDPDKEETDNAGEGAGTGETVVKKKRKTRQQEAKKKGCKKPKKKPRKKKEAKEEEEEEESDDDDDESSESSSEVDN